MHVYVQVSIDLFVAARQSVDLASLSDLCGPTGGQLYHYCPFMSPSDDDQLYNDLRWNVQRPQVSSCTIWGVHKCLLRRVIKAS